MKRINLAGIGLLAWAAVGQPALAADLPVKAPVRAPVAAPIFTWTGCYIGGHVGYGWAREQWDYGYYDGTDYNLDYGSHTTKGILGGGQIGCNYQTGAWVLGLEGDFSWTGMDGSHVYDGDYFHSTKLDWIATLTGRLGYAFGQSLLYVKGGIAWDRGSYNMLLDGISYSDKVTRTGWTIGGGWEYGLTPNWSFKLEYNFIDFGKDDVWWDYQYANDPWSYHVSQKIHVVKAGINYRFGGARY